MSFKGKAIIITGASSGIGQALAITLAQQGANLALAARNSEALEKTVQLCLQSAGTAISVTTDVTDPAACQRLIDHTVDTFGQIDCLVNNAGTTFVSRFDEVSDLSIFEQVLQVNFLGAVYCTHAALPFLKQTQGLLVAISSLCGKSGVPMRSGYVASKHAVQGFFDSLRIELRESGIDVLVVSPGFVATGIREKAFRGDGSVWNHSHRDENSQTMPLEKCVQLIVEGMSKRQREVLMTRKGKFLPWAKLIAPKWVDGLMAKTLMKP